MPCVALFEEDEMFYRAKLVSFKDNFHMEVGNDLLLPIGVEAKVCAYAPKRVYTGLGPVSRKSRNFSGSFRVT